MFICGQKTIFLCLTAKVKKKTNICLKTKHTFQHKNYKYKTKKKLLTLVDEFSTREFSHFALKYSYWVFL